jgi:hypothetical protein
VTVSLFDRTALTAAFAGHDTLRTANRFSRWRATTSGLFPVAVPPICRRSISTTRPTQSLPRWKPPLAFTTLSTTSRSPSGIRPRLCGRRRSSNVDPCTGPERTRAWRPHHLADTLTSRQQQTVSRCNRMASLLPQRLRRLCRDRRYGKGEREMKAVRRHQLQH